MKINIFKEIVKVYKVSKKECWIKLTSALFMRGMLLIIPVLFSASINMATKGNYKQAMIYIAISILAAIAYRWSEANNQYTLYLLYNKLYYYYDCLGIEKTNENSMFSLSRFTVGQYSNILTTDVDVIAAFFANLIMRIVQVVELAVIYSYFLAIDIYLFIGAIVISIVVMLLIPTSNKKVEKYNGEKKTENDKLTASLHEYFKNIKDIKCFDIYDKIAPSVKEQSQKYIKANSKYFVKYLSNQNFFLGIFEVFRLLSVGYGIYLIMNGRTEIGSLVIIYNYYQKIIDNFTTVITIGVEYAGLKTSLARFNHLIEYSIPKNENHSSQEYITNGKITFKNILYGYKKDPMLKNLSLQITPNALNVITGKAGTGKTGIFDLLLKLNRQHTGEITIDDTNIDDIPDSEYFSKISLLKRSPALFNMSIKDNLFLVEKDENKILDICEKLGIHNEIIKLNDGYNTIISDNDNIPASLKQMIAIARIILKGTKIMLFDESLLGLNDEEQQKVINLLLELKSDHTIVMISHEHIAIDNADVVITMNFNSGNITREAIED